jgi:hypothetical protein
MDTTTRAELSLLFFSKGSTPILAYGYVRITKWRVNPAALLIRYSTSSSNSFCVYGSEREAVNVPVDICTPCGLHACASSDSLGPYVRTWAVPCDLSI